VSTLDGHGGRILVVPPTLRDAKATEDILLRAGLSHCICKSIPALVREMRIGAGALLLTDDSLTMPGLSELLRAIDSQPAWSDIPVIVLMRSGADTATVANILKSLRNVTLLDRPVAARVLTSAAEVAVRSRLRQYEIRDLINSEQSARREAENAARAKDEFLAVVSHELRTPLNGIFGWAQILKRKPPTPEALSEGLNAIERGARAQTRLIEDILDMSRITSGKVHLDLQDIEACPFMEAAIETVKPDADAKNIQIVQALDAKAGPIEGDPARLQQVALNLLSNAVKFTPPGGEIQVACRHLRDQVEITVSDTGIGIEPGFLPHVFDQFRQADSSSTRSYGGLGLGLAIVKQLVELHGGSVSASSPGRNKGATFKVILPIGVAGGAKSNPAVDCNGFLDKCSHPDLAGLRVLVVDDDADAVEVVRIVLEECKAHVTAARSSAEALHTLKTQLPDVLLSDIGMPEMDGFELIREIRRLGKPIPAIAVTAFARPEDRARALEAGFNSHVSKPIEPDHLLSVIQTLTQAPLSQT
jgi:signal transduction histidine kinase/ActR/RegA family two-component response regulator